MKKLVGKRVVARVTVVTEMPGPDGKPIKLASTLAGIRYDGNLMLDSIADVSLQPTIDLVGTVDEVETPSTADPKKSEKRVRLTVAGDQPVAYLASTAAAKKLRVFVGKKVAVRAYATGSALDDVETASAVREAEVKPPKRP